MSLATSYPLLEVFWTMLIFFAFVVWIWLLFTVFADIFRRKDSGWVKTAWILFVVILPYLGVFVYLIAEHTGMQERALQKQSETAEQMADYVRSVSDGNAPAEQIAKAQKLKEAGTISDAEFQQIKNRALAG